MRATTSRFTRFALGHCSGVLTPLERSEAIQGPRAEIDELRERVERALCPAAAGRDGQRQGQGKEGRDKGDEGEG